MSRLWGLMLVRGILSIVLGIALLAWPAEGAEAFITIFGLFALATGVLAIIDAVSPRHRLWGVPLTGAVVTLLIGLVALLWPGMTATVLMWLVGLWAIFFGLLQVIAGALIPPVEGLRALVMGIGLFTLALGILLLVDPLVGVKAASVLLGFYLVVGGALTIYRALMMRRAHRVVIVHGRAW